MKLSLTIASENDAAQIAAILNEAAQHLTVSYGKGHWCYQTSENGVRNGMKGNSKVFIAKQGEKVVGTLHLSTKKPWAIDPSYFTKVVQPLYLTGMAVRPVVQRKGIGKFMVQQLLSYVILWEAQAIRLDAYDADAGAGGFYRKCGFAERGRVIYRKVPLVYFELLM